MLRYRIILLAHLKCNLGDLEEQMAPQAVIVVQFAPNIIGWLSKAAALGRLVKPHFWTCKSSRLWEISARHRRAGKIHAHERDSKDVRRRGVPNFQSLQESAGKLNVLLVGFSGHLAFVRPNPLHSLLTMLIISRFILNSRSAETKWNHLRFPCFHNRKYLKKDLEFTCNGLHMARCFSQIWPSSLPWKSNERVFFSLSSSVDSIAIQTLERKVKTAKIPDISGDAHTPIGHVSYSLSRWVCCYTTSHGSLIWSHRSPGLQNKWKAIKAATNDKTEMENKCDF